MTIFKIECARAYSKQQRSYLNNARPGEPCVLRNSMVPSFSLHTSSYLATTRLKSAHASPTIHENPSPKTAKPKNLCAPPCTPCRFLSLSKGRGNPTATYPFNSTRTPHQHPNTSTLSSVLPRALRAGS